MTKTVSRIVHQVRNFFRHPPDVNRQSYIDARNRVNKIKRQVNYKRRILNFVTLKKLTHKNSGPLSGLRKVQDAVENDIILKYFERILGENLPDEVLNLMNNEHFENVGIDILDSEITKDEIVNLIKKKKPKKNNHLN